MAFDESLAHLLNERRIATLTTLGKDGLPQVTAVWFLYEDGAFYIATSSRTGKCRNLRGDPRVAICVESRQAGREAGLSAAGEAELLEEAAARPFAERVNRKYLTDAALAHPRVGPAFENMSDIVIRVTPSRWISWDMGALGEELFGEPVDEAALFKPLLR